MSVHVKTYKNALDGFFEKEALTMPMIPEEEIERIKRETDLGGGRPLAGGGAKAPGP